MWWMLHVVGGLKSSERDNKIEQAVNFYLKYLRIRVWLKSIFHTGILYKNALSRIRFDQKAEMCVGPSYTSKIHFAALSWYGCAAAPGTARCFAVRLIGGVLWEWEGLSAALFARSGHELGACFHITLSLKRAGVNGKYSPKDQKKPLDLPPVAF